MKRTVFYLLLIGFILQSCVKEQKTVVQNTTTSTTSSTSSSSSGSGSSTTGTGSGATCYGTTADGYDDSITGAIPRVPFYNIDINMPGEGTSTTVDHDWTPGKTGYVPSIPTVEEAKYWFSSDTRLKVRLKVLSLNRDCSSRTTGAQVLYPYKQLKFTINLRQANADGTVGSVLRSFALGPVSDGSCSSVLSIPIIPTTYGNVVEIADVRSDSDCQAYQANTSGYDSSYCTNWSKVRQSDCWRAVLQIVNDSTYNFR